MEDLDIKEALNRLPREIVDARNQRLKRAIDLSMKHEYLPEDLQVCSLCVCNNLLQIFILHLKMPLVHVSVDTFVEHDE